MPAVAAAAASADAPLGAVPQVASRRAERRAAGRFMVGGGLLLGAAEVRCEVLPTDGEWSLYGGHGMMAWMHCICITCVLSLFHKYRRTYVMKVN